MSDDHDLPSWGEEEEGDKELSDAEKKQLCFAHLEEKPMDYGGCADLLGMEYWDFLSFRGKHLKEFQNYEERIHADIQAGFYQRALAGDHSAALHVSKAKMGWSSTTKVEKVEKKKKSTGEAKRLLDDYYSKQGKIGDDSTPVRILSSQERRNLQ